MANGTEFIALRLKEEQELFVVRLLPPRKFGSRRMKRSVRYILKPYVL
jgi:hypothetical protein